MTNTKILASASAENIGEIDKTNILAGGSAFVADEPKEFGGGETGPAPADYLSMVDNIIKIHLIHNYKNSCITKIL